MGDFAVVELDNITIVRISGHIPETEFNLRYATVDNFTGAYFRYGAENFMRHGAPR